MKICIVDERIPDEAKRRLSIDGFYIIEAKKSKNLPAPLASHPDMLLFFNEGKIITYSEYYDSNTELIDRIARICKCGTV